MRDSAFGPPAIPPDFWSRPEVTAALARRDIGELFRLLKTLRRDEPDPDRRGDRQRPGPGQPDHPRQLRGPHRQEPGPDRRGPGHARRRAGRPRPGTVQSRARVQSSRACCAVSPEPRDSGPVPGHDQRRSDRKHQPVAGRRGPRPRADLRSTGARRLDLRRAGLAGQ